MTTHYPIEAHHYNWEHLFHTLVLNNHGRRGLDTSTMGRQLRIEDDKYAVMSFDDAKVLLQANYNTRPEEYDPNNGFRSPMLPARWWSYLNRRLRGKAPWTILHRWRAHH